MATTLPAGTSFGTLDLKVNFLRPVKPDGRAIAVSTVRIDDADGRRVAMATSATISEGRPWPAPTG